MKKIVISLLMVHSIMNSTEHDTIAHALKNNGELIYNDIMTQAQAQHVTLFQYVCAQGYTTLVKSLLPLVTSDDIHQNNSANQTAFTLAVLSGKTGVVELLLPYIDSEYFTGGEFLSLVITITQNHHHETTALLAPYITRATFKGYTGKSNLTIILKAAAQHGDIAVIKQLVSFLSPEELGTKFENNTKQQLEIAFVSQGGQAKGYTALMLAAHNGHADIVDILVEHMRPQDIICSGNLDESYRSFSAFQRTMYSYESHVCESSLCKPDCYCVRILSKLMRYEQFDGVIHFFENLFSIPRGYHRGLAIIQALPQGYLTTAHYEALKAKTDTLNDTYDKKTALLLVEAIKLTLEQQ